MPRVAGTACLLALSLAGSLLVAPPAQAQWSDIGGLTDYRICRTATGHGGWKFVSRVSKRDGTPDARAGVRVLRMQESIAGWRSGWLDDDEVARGAVRVRKGKGVRLVVWEEAGDRESPIGTATQSTVHRPQQIRHC